MARNHEGRGTSHHKGSRDISWGDTLADRNGEISGTPKKCAISCRILRHIYQLDTSSKRIPSGKLTKLYIAIEHGHRNS